MEEYRGTQGKTDFRFHSFCMSAILSHQVSLKSEVKGLRQVLIPQMPKHFFPACGLHTPSIGLRFLLQRWAASSTVCLGGSWDVSGVVSVRWGPWGTVRRDLGSQFQVSEPTCPSALWSVHPVWHLVLVPTLPLEGTPGQLTAWGHSWQCTPKPRVPALLLQHTLPWMLSHCS